MPRTFLTARWRNLILANFAVPEDLLRPLVPPGCVLDRRDGAYWASLVGFQFLDTRVLGIGWPGFRNFPEWNLRFYVSHEGRRGVCFVREFVPQWTVATMARLIYNEPYRAARMSMKVEESRFSPTNKPREQRLQSPGSTVTGRSIKAELITAEYTVKWAGRVHRLRAAGDLMAQRPPADSVEHWFKEHSWGFGTSRRGRLIRYEVNHPEWDVYPMREFAFDVDWALMYGPEWAPMNGVQPASVVFAVGSEVSVYPKG